MISPCTINIPDERLATIRAKVEAYDWSQLPDAGGWSADVTAACASVVAAITGAILTEENGRLGLFLMMLSSAVVALGAALLLPKPHSKRDEADRLSITN